MYIFTEYLRYQLGVIVTVTPEYILYLYSVRDP